MPTWSNGLNLRGRAGDVGPRGNGFSSGTAVPPDDLGSNGDTYLNRSSRQFYSKANGTWSAVGLAYNTLSVGTAVPGTNFGFDSDAYVRVANGVTTFWQKSGITWSQLATLTGSNGADGAAGLSVLSASGPPSSSVGVVGQPGYIDTTNLVIYGAKTSSGWPTGVSIAPIKGDKGDVGPASPGLYSGTGAPSATNPSGAQVDGSYYIRNDVSPALLYGPRANGVWPAAAQTTGGSQSLIGNGPPSASTGSVGDVYYDLQNSFFYPPKQAAGWTLAPINQVGPAGPSMQVQPTFGTFGQGFGPSGQLNNVTVSSTGTGANVPGMPGVQYFTPNTNSAFVGGTIVNFSNSAGTLTFTLTNNTTNQTVYSTSIARGTVQNLGQFASTLYPMTAGNQYVWNVTGSGAAYCNVMPMYLFPSSFSGNVGVAQNAVLLAKAVGTTAVTMSPPSLTDQTSYYVNPYASYLYSVSALASSTSGTATVQFQLYNSTTSAVIWQSPQVIASTTGTTYNSGVFNISQAYIPVNNTAFWRIIGVASNSGTVTASITPTVAQ